MQDPTLAQQLKSLNSKLDELIRLNRLQVDLLRAMLKAPTVREIRKWLGDVQREENRGGGPDTTPQRAASKS